MIGLRIADYGLRITGCGLRILRAVISVFISQSAIRNPQYMARVELKGGVPRVRIPSIRPLRPWLVLLVLATLASGILLAQYQKAPPDFGGSYSFPTPTHPEPRATWIRGSTSQCWPWDWRWQRG